MATATLTTRTVQSLDPTLSDEANALITAELRAIIGRDAVQLPPGSPDHSRTPRGTHSKLIASAIAVRIEIALVVAVLVVTALIAVAMTAELTWLVAAVTVLLLPTVSWVAWSVMRLFDEHEHLDPETAALLAAEGVGDPDKAFNELVHDFDGTRPSRM